MSVFNNTCNQDKSKWYDEVDINSIDLVEHYEPMSTNNWVYNEVKIFDLLDEVTIQHDNCQTLFKLKDPYKFQMYDLPWAQMDDGIKCTVTNNINLLENVRYYNWWF